MRSMRTAYSTGSSMRVPPRRTCSATTPARRDATSSMKRGGHDHSRPTSRPTLRGVISRSLRGLLLRGAARPRPCDDTICSARAPTSRARTVIMNACRAPDAEKTPMQTDDQVAEWLVRWEDALAAGRSPPSLDQLPPELHEAAREGMRML